jgi:hypothetical protein
MWNDEDEDEKTAISKAYQRAGFGLAAAALLWFGAYIYAGTQHWQEQNLFIPLACTALSVLCFSMYLKSRR